MLLKLINQAFFPYFSHVLHDLPWQTTAKNRTPSGLEGSEPCSGAAAAAHAGAGAQQAGNPWGNSWFSLYPTFSYRFEWGFQPHFPQVWVLYIVKVPSVGYSENQHIPSVGYSEHQLYINGMLYNVYNVYIYIANTMLMYNIELMDYWINVNITYYLNIFLRSLDIVHVYLIYNIL